MGLQDLWSLSVDELLVAERIKKELKSVGVEVFFPLNKQLRDIDLVVYNLKRRRVITLQVKGSRTYEPKKSERERFGEGSAAWFTIRQESIFNPKYKVDFFVLVLHSLRDGARKKEISISYLVIPTKELRKVSEKKTLRKGKKYHYFVWIDEKGKRALEFNEPGVELRLSKYLNKWANLN